MVGVVGVGQEQVAHVVVVTVVADVHRKDGSLH